MRIVRIVIIVAIGATTGLLWNTVSGRGMDLFRNALVKEGDQLLSVTEAKGKLDQGALFVDARPLAFFKMGHVPGAVSLPENEFDHVFPLVERVLRSRLDVIVYCAGFGCEASHILARRLKQHGIPAAVLADGWPAWQEARLPERSGEMP